MQRSTAALMLATAMGMPAWIVKVSTLPAWVQAAWLAAILMAAAAGLALWAIDGR